MINNVVLCGRLTKDPELRYTPSGVPMARFTLAVNRQFKKEGQPEADFVNCLAFNKTAENLANYMKKGSLIGLTGRIQTGSYEGQDGKKVYTTDVIADNIQFLESRNNNDGQQQQPNTQQGGYQQPPQQQYQQQPQQQPQHQQPQYQQQQPQNNAYSGVNMNGVAAHDVSQHQYQQLKQQQNYQRMDEDPFARGNGPDINPDDLPF